MTATAADRRSAADVILDYAPHSTVGQFEVRTKAAAAWVDENVDTEGYNWNGTFLTVEWRYIDAIACGLLGAGFDVRGF